jgi:hypothetical protein
VGSHALAWGARSWGRAGKGVGVGRSRGERGRYGAGDVRGGAGMPGPNHQYGMASDMQWPTQMTLGEDSGLHFGNTTQNNIPSLPPLRRRKVRVQGQFIQLDAGAISDISEYESIDEEDATIRNVGSEALKHAYRDGTWSQKCFTYDPKPQEFVGRRGMQQFFLLHANNSTII